VVAVPARGVEVESTAQHTVVSCRDLVVPPAAVRPQVRPGSRGYRTGDVQGHGVVAGSAAAVIIIIIPGQVAPHIGLQGAVAAGGQADVGRDRVVAVPALGLDVEAAVQHTCIGHVDGVGPAAAIGRQIQPGAAGDVHPGRSGSRVVGDGVGAVVAVD